MSSSVRNEVISIDVGNKLIDVIREGAKDAIIVPNVITQKDDVLKVETSIFSSSIKSDEKQILAEIIDDNGKLEDFIYLGAAAIKRGGEERAIKKEKYNDRDIAKAIHVMTAFSILKDNKNTSEAIVDLVTSLPLREYTHINKVAEFISMVAGEKTINMHGGSLNGLSIKIRIQEDRITVLPEGAVALFNIITTKDGKLRKEYEEFIGRVVVVIDIGGGTVDIMAVTINIDEDGSLVLDPEEDLIGSMEEGILTAEQDVIDYLYNEKNYEIGKADLDHYVRNNGCKLPNGMQEDIDISEEVEKAFDKLARKISKKVDNIIMSAPPMVQRRIIKLAFTGGGSLARVNEGKEIYSKISEELNIKASVSASPLTDNMEGSMKVYLASRYQNKLEDNEVFEKKVTSNGKK